MPDAPGWRPAALRDARIAAGLTQHQLARAVGVAGGERVSRWELGTSAPRLHLVRRLATVLDVSAEQLLTSPSGPLGLRELRVAAGVSAQELAGRAQVSVPTVVRWESGRFVRLPPREVLELLAAGLGVPVGRVEAALLEARRDVQGGDPRRARDETTRKR